jgi:hypothetical protein
MGVFYSGKDGNVDIGAATAVKMSSWDLEMEADIIDTNNFESGGYDENLEGFKRATINCKGPYNTGSTAVTVGASVSIALTVGGSIVFTITSRIGKVKVSTDVKGAAQLDIMAKSNGSFTAAIT